MRQMLRGIGSEQSFHYHPKGHVLESPDVLKAMVKVDHAVTDISDSL